MLQPDCISALQQVEKALQNTGINWNLARIKFLARFLVALIAVKSVCVNQIASAFPGTAQTASHDKRIRRFLRHFDLDMGSVAGLVLALLNLPPPWVLALDRTNWKLGKTQINVLVLALVHQGIAFPLFWMVLGRAGNSTTEQRLMLVQQFVERFGKERIAFLCAAREFIGKRWVGWLVKTGVPFRLRVKADTLIANGRGELCCAAWLFRDCPMGKERFLAGPRLCLGQRLFVSGTRLCSGEFLIVVSDREAPLWDYGKRWGIETLFGVLKSRGFDLEATHVTESERLSKLLALLSIALCWAFAAGEWLSQQKPLKLKKHGRAAVSLFRRGLNWLRRVLLPLCGRYEEEDFQLALRFLSRT